ncbi:hypothetical protein NBRC111894_3910 [Sporolactobacillus inulinus]|uniref:Uncharacterized protein n=1 Tax=Sporolactobacillus inulinus TaxID=2078 RepID=A0A4Y1ZGP3_9BACL|nr:hypothetical protein NBRC111894_3910 [Sporolactobacillus inulinus]
MHQPNLGAARTLQRKKVWNYADPSLSVPFTSTYTHCFLN